MINFKKSELEPSQKIIFLGYHFDLVQGKVFPTEMKLKILQKSIQDIEISSNNPKMADVPDRCTSIYGKDYTNGSVTHASPSVISQDKLAISPVTRPEDSGFKPLKTSSVVERSKQCVTRGSLAKKKIMFLHSKNKASRKGYKGEC